MTFRWIAPVVLLSFVVIFSSMIAQDAPPAAATVSSAEEPAAAPPAPAALPAVTTPPAVAAPPTPAVPAAPAALAATPQPPATAPPAAAARPQTSAAPAAPATPAVPASPAKPRPSTRTSAVFQQRTVGAADEASETQTVVIRLRNTEAPTVNNILQNLLANDEYGSARFTSDTQSNSLILRGPQDDVARIRKLVEQLDSEAAAARLPAVQAQQPAAHQRIRSAQNAGVASSTANPAWATANRSLTAAESKLMQEYANLERQSTEAAKQYRKGVETLGDNHPQQKDRREQIGNLVEKAFDARQALQGQELKQLKERIAKVEQSLAKRAQNRSEIIAKRVKELLEEDRDLEWNAVSASAIPAANAASQTVATPVRLPDGTLTLDEVDAPRPHPPATAKLPVIVLPPSDTSGFAAAPSDLDPFARSTEQPNKAYPEQPPAQPAGAEQRRALTTANEMIVRKEAEVAAWKKRLKESELQENPEYQSALRDLQFAKRQLNNANRESAAMIKLLQLDLDAAAADHDAARELLSLNEQLEKRNNVSKESLIPLRAAVRQAEVRVQRAQTLLDLHRAVAASSENVPEQAASTPTDPAGNPAPKNRQ